MFGGNLFDREEKPPVCLLRRSRAIQQTKAVMIMIWYMTTFAGESCFPTPLRCVRASLVIHIWGPRFRDSYDTDEVMTMTWYD